jgi:hypothetical protein
MKNLLVIILVILGTLIISPLDEGYDDPLLAELNAAYARADLFEKDARTLRVKKYKTITDTWREWAEGYERLAQSERAKIRELEKVLFAPPHE